MNLEFLIPDEFMISLDLKSKVKRKRANSERNVLK